MADYSKKLERLISNIKFRIDRAIEEDNMIGLINFMSSNKYHGMILKINDGFARSEKRGYNSESLSEEFNQLVSNAEYRAEEFIEGKKEELNSALRVKRRRKRRQDVELENSIRNYYPRFYKGTLVGFSSL